MAGEQINKMGDMPTMEYFSVINRKDSLTPAKTWMNHEDVMLSEVNQSRKTNTVQFYSYGVTRRVKTTVTESRMICQRLGAGRMKSCCLVNRLSVSQDEGILETGCTTKNMLNTTELHT